VPDVQGGLLLLQIALQLPEVGPRLLGLAVKRLPLGKQLVAGVQLGVLPSRGGLGERALLVLRGFGLRVKERS